MSRTVLNPVSELQLDAFYKGNNVYQIIYEPSGGPAGQNRANRATRRKIEQIVLAAQPGSTLNLKISYLYEPLGLWISGKWFNDLEGISYPEPKIENYDFDADAWAHAKIHEVMIDAA